MNRIAFFQIPSFTAAHLDGLTSAFALNPYSDEVGQGFLMERVRRDTCAGTFIRKEHQIIEGYDAHESPFVQEQISFLRYRFRLSIKGPSLQLVNPPRNLRFFFNKLTDFSSGRFTVVPLELDPLRFVECFRRIGKFTVSKVQIRDILIPSTKLVFSGNFRGDANVARDVKAFLNEGGEAISGVSGDFVPLDSRLSVRIEVRQSGCISVSKELTSEMQRTIREFVIESPRV